MLLMIATPQYLNIQIHININILYVGQFTKLKKHNGGKTIEMCHVTEVTYLTLRYGNFFFASLFNITGACFWK